jgi:hypothetical protein
MSLLARAVSQADDLVQVGSSLGTLGLETLHPPTYYRSADTRLLALGDEGMTVSPALPSCSPLSTVREVLFGVADVGSKVT